VRLVVLLVLAVGAAGCGGEAAAPELPEPLAASALPELSFRERDLPRDVLAEDSFTPEELEALLGDVGYAGGREREFTGHTDTLDRVVARALRFDSSAGAARYVDWVATHTDELAGPTRPPEPLAVGTVGLLFELEPCPTCKKQLPTMLAVWRRGGAVGYLLTAGRGAGGERVTALVRDVDAALGG
jgi:hypothetical protein